MEYGKEATVFASNFGVDKELMALMSWRPDLRKLVIDKKF